MFGVFPGDLGYVSPGANVQAVCCLRILPLLVVLFVVAMAIRLSRSVFLLIIV